MIENVLSADNLSIDILDLSYGDTEDLIAKHPQFEMYPLVANWTVSEDLGRFDKYWPDESRRLTVLSPHFVDTMGLKRVPISLNYADGNSFIVSKFEAWDADHHRNEFGSRERYARGTRYLLDRNTLKIYLQKTNRSLVLKVNITRNRPSRYDQKAERDFSGKTYGFVYDKNGKLSIC